ncbi:hypothetical protein LPJGGPFB_02605 [Ensifer adhaerens]|uniref:hypothetical protein n=1 Tax=Ensifer adhaerens TaxID=106592 RepID=UPI001567EF01|nr:hypothetical protein [Ensifer adhaerens]NRP19350.1 hypothetical protein [Ensifer adhaerens]
MKIMIAIVASLAMASSAFAAVSSTSVEKRASVKAKQVELALGKNRSGQTTPSNGRTFR